MKTIKKIQKIIWLTMISLMANFISFADTAAMSTNANKGIDNNDAFLRWTLAGIIALFVVIFLVLAKAIKVAGTDYQKKISETKHHKILPLIIMIMLSNSGMLKASGVNRLTAISFNQWDVYLMFGVILLLFIALLVLVRSLFVLMGIGSEHKQKEAQPEKKIKTIFQKFNETVPIEEEDTLDLSHNYDGIRELDNKVPSWWSWTFVASMLFGVIYLYRMFGSETLPDQITELKIANEIAAEQKLEYLKKGANNVDENSVVLLGDAEISQGAQLYTKNCVACHGDRGQGNSVGPNLTDDYWIHKGGIKDIFYTIKYGWADKGMKSWKEDLSPGQIAQVASFVHSLHGSNPPNQKEKQGELYMENADSTLKATTDTISKTN